MIQFLDAEQRPESRAIANTILWTRNFISRPKPGQNVVDNRRNDSGGTVTAEHFRANDRLAHVCPFVEEAIEKRLFWIREFPDDERDAIVDILRAQIPAFLEMAPAYRPSPAQPATGDTRLKTFMSVFPRVLHDSKGAMPLFDDIHADLKPEFMDAGLMLGQFYASCPQTGIYSELFRPLRSPWPTFAVRYMVVHDHLFSGEGHIDRYRRFFPA